MSSLKSNFDSLVVYQRPDVVFCSRRILFHSGSNLWQKSSIEQKRSIKVSSVIFNLPGVVFCGKKILLLGRLFSIKFHTQKFIWLIGDSVYLCKMRGIPMNLAHLLERNLNSDKKTINDSGRNKISNRRKLTIKYLQEMIIDLMVNIARPLSF